MKTNLGGFVFVPLSLCLVSSVSAATLGTLNAGKQSELRVMAGVLSGRSGEYVYDADAYYTGIAGYKLSELQWQLNNVRMIGVGFSQQVNAIAWKIDVWKNAGQGDGTMDDRDWLPPYIGYDWSDWSHHDDTVVRNVGRLNLRAEFPVARQRGFQLFGVAGLRQDHLDWQARGGTALYSVNSFRDTYFTFPDVPGISYQQTYRTPYFGLRLKSATQWGGTKVSLNASLGYSQWVEANDVDVHHLRHLRFEGAGRGGVWMGYEVRLVADFPGNMSMFVEYASQEYQEVKATVTITDLDSGQTGVTAANSAGLNHTSQSASFGIAYAL